VIDEKTITAKVETIVGDVKGVNAIRVNIVPFVIEE
jgi:hypothetical protein